MNEPIRRVFCLKTQTTNKYIMLRQLTCVSSFFMPIFNLNQVLLLKSFPAQLVKNEKHYAYQAEAQTMALQAKQLLLLVQPYTSYFIHIRLIVQSLINNTHNISMEVPCPRMLSNKQHPLVLGHKVTNTNTRQYSSMQGALAEGLARGCLFGHYIESCLFLTLPYMSLTSKPQQQKVRTNT